MFSAKPGPLSCTVSRTRCPESPSRVRITTSPRCPVAPAAASAQYYERGYGWIFTKHIKQAHDGCDFDFLRADYGGPTPEPAIN